MKLGNSGSGAFIAHCDSPLYTTMTFYTGQKVHRLNECKIAAEASCARIYVSDFHWIYIPRYFFAVS